MPKDAIPFVGNHHRNRDLGIDLGQSAAQAPDVKIAILELASTVKVLSLRGKEFLADRERLAALDFCRNDMAA